MTLKLESKHFLIIGKIISTIILLGIIFFWTLFLIIILPMIMIVISHSQKRSMSSVNLSIAMIPAMICGLLIWRLWYPRWDPNFLGKHNFEIVKKHIPTPIAKRIVTR